MYSVQTSTLTHQGSLQPLGNIFVVGSALEDRKDQSFYAPPRVWDMWDILVPTGHLGKGIMCQKL